MRPKKRPYAERLRLERARLGISQAQLAEAGGVSKTTELAYEADKYVFDVEYLDAVGAVGVDTTYVQNGLRVSEFVVQNFDWDLHQQLIVLALEAAELENVVLPPAKLAQIVRMLYTKFSESKRIEPAELAGLLRLVA